MPDVDEFLLGEFRRSLDERYRLSIPGELAGILAAPSPTAFWPRSAPAA